MIVVFGSLNVDMVKRLKAMPRPGETVLCPEYTLVPGGKGGNQALAAAKTGVNVKLFGMVGDDDFGKLSLEALKEANVDLTGLEITKEAATGCATVCVDDAGENMIVVASGANGFAKESEIPDFLLTEKTTLLLQMETPEEENWKLIRRAKKIGARIILNLAPAQKIPPAILQSLSVLVMNQIEATVLALHLGFDVISPTVAARRIAANYGITCVVTLGSDGAFACTPDAAWSVEAMKIDAKDTTAAGDAFVGVLCATLDQGKDLRVALRRASVASGLACTTPGAQSSLPNSARIDAEISAVPMPKKVA